MTADQIGLAFANLLGGFLLVGLAIPLVKRRIPRNKWYGVRIQKALQSEELWYQINAYGGRQMIIWSVPIILTGIVCLFVPLDETLPELVHFALGPGVMLACLVVAVVRTLLYARKLWDAPAEKSRARSPSVAAGRRLSLPAGEGNRGYHVSVEAFLTLLYIGRVFRRAQRSSVLDFFSAREGQCCLRPGFVTLRCLHPEHSQVRMEGGGT